MRLLNLVILLLCAEYLSCEDVDQMQKNFEWVSSIFEGYTAPIRPFRPIASVRQDCPSCKCGVPKTTRRIVGGDETVVQKYPWMALLMFRGQGFCGGTLISDKYILCAAHCTVVPKENVTMRLLEHDTTSDKEKVLDLEVEEIIPHSGYSKATMDNDIALYKLKDKMDLTEKRVVTLDNRQLNDISLRTICMPANDLDYVGVDALVTGWGHIKENGPASTFLREVIVPVVANTDCQKSYRRKITDNMLCAGYAAGGKDSCQGDSGGPLHITDSGTQRMHQIGVVSFGSGCARPRRYGVYARVDKYLDWITQNIGDSCRCEG